MRSAIEEGGGNRRHRKNLGPDGREIVYSPPTPLQFVSKVCYIQLESAQPTDSPVIYRYGIRATRVHELPRVLVKCSDYDCVINAVHFRFVISRTGTTFSSNILGLSFCLSTWVIPNMFLAPPPSQIKQFIATVTKGARYLMRASRTVMLLLVIITWLTASSSDPSVSAGWKSWLITIFVLIPTAPYEIYFIFPINDRVMEMNHQIAKDGEELTEQQKKELSSLLNKWAYRNFGRVAMPFMAGILGIYNLTVSK